MNYKEFLDEVLRLNPTNGRRAVNEIQELARNEYELLITLDTEDVKQSNVNPFVTAGDAGVTNRIST